MIPPSTSTRCPAIGGALGPGPQRQGLGRSGRKRRSPRPHSSDASVPAGGRRMRRKLRGRAGARKTGSSGNQPGRSALAVRVRGRTQLCLKTRCPENCVQSDARGRWGEAWGRGLAGARKGTCRWKTCGVEKPYVPTLSGLSSCLAGFCKRVFLFSQGSCRVQSCRCKKGLDPAINRPPSLWSGLLSLQAAPPYP